LQFLNRRIESDLRSNTHEIRLLTVRFVCTFLTIFAALTVKAVPSAKPLCSLLFESQPRVPGLGKEGVYDFWVTGRAQKKIQCSGTCLPESGLTFLEYHTGELFSGDFVNILRMQKAVEKVIDSGDFRNLQFMEFGMAAARRSEFPNFLRKYGAIPAEKFSFTKSFISEMEFYRSGYLGIDSLSDILTLQSRTPHFFSKTMESVTEWRDFINAATYTQLLYLRLSEIRADVKSALSMDIVNSLGKEAHGLVLRALEGVGSESLMQSKKQGERLAEIVDQIVEIPSFNNSQALHMLANIVEFYRKPVWLSYNHFREHLSEEGRSPPFVPQNYEILNQGQNGHAVVVTGVKRDSSGNPTWFAIQNTHRDRPTLHLHFKYLLKAFRSAFYIPPKASAR